MLQQAPRYACSTYFLSTSKDFLSCSQYTQDLTQLLTYLRQQKIKHARIHRGKNKILKPRLQVYEGTTNGNKISESLISKDFIFQFRQPREGGRSHYEKSCYLKEFTDHPLGDTKPQKVFMVMRAYHHGEPQSVKVKVRLQPWGRHRLDTWKAGDSFLS